MRHILIIVWCVTLCTMWNAASTAAAPQQLYATDTETQQLFILSTTNGERSLVGSFGVSGYMGGLTYDARDDILYGTTTSTDCLYSINRVTGAATLIGSLGVSLMHGIAFDNVNGVLYGTSTGNSCLYKISTATGNATLVGNIGNFDAEISGLAFNPADNALYGCMSGPKYQGGLIRIDPTTGQGTFLFSTQPLVGLAFDPATGVLYGADNGIGVFSDGLYRINMDNGSASRVGLTGMGNNLDIAFAPVPEPSSLIAILCGTGALLISRRKK